MADRLERLRDRAHNQMNYILRFAEAITETTSVEDITSRLQILEDRYHTFNELELQLFESPTYKPITEVVDEIYYKSRALLMKARGTHGQHGTNTNQDLNTTLEQFIGQQKTFYEGVNMSQQVRLPKINIEQFSGNYKNWASFHDLFRTTVHDNQNISDVHKLQMLKGLLSGEAASLIRHIPITENNYVEAWDKLCNRYNKMNPIVTSLIQAFFEQKACVQANGKDLRHLTETSDEIIRGLRALGPNAETRDPWIIQVLLNKLDDETKQMWAIESVGKDFPTFEALLEFLNKRCDALEICGVPAKKFTSKHTSKSFVTSYSNTTFQCIVCKQPHLLFRCPVFKNQNLDARLKIANEQNLCRNCLKQGHLSEKCFSKSSCLICNKRHHTLLHPAQSEIQPVSKQISTNHHVSLNQATVSTADPKPTVEQTPNVTNAQVLHTLYCSPTTVLPTAIVYAKSRTGELQPFRALLDSGSQTSLVTESTAQRLGLQRSQASISINGLASTSAGQTRGKIDMTIYSRIDQNYYLNITAHIISNITTLLPTKPIAFQNKIEEVHLADPEFFKPSKIDLLLGTDVFFKILNPEKRELDGFPILQASKLGWLIAGTFHNQSSNIINLHATTDSIIQTTNDDLQQSLKKFWEVEKIGSQINPTKPLNLCEEYYEQTTTRNADGRFTVKYFLPHHAVTKASSSTTNLRVILDAPWKTTSQVPLNDILQIGTNIQTELSTILETVPRIKWQHIESKQNPADIISRGVKPQVLAKSQLWWHGPDLLSQPQSNWPESKSTAAEINHSALEEKTKYLNVSTEVTKENVLIKNLLTQCSSWFKIRKIVVYILRFGTLSRWKQRKKQPNKTVASTELHEPENVIIRNVQQRVHKAEMSILSKNSSLPTKYHLSSLDPFVDTNGLLRVGGRLRKSSLSYTAQQHPIILPKSQIICEKIIHDIHVKHMHAGSSLMLSIVRTKYWMIDARYIIKHCTQSCIISIRYRFTKCKQKMADLLAVRCTQSRPFSKIGLDYSGPFNIKTSKRKNSPSEKAYAFVCLVVKAVHLSRTPEEIYCDNGFSFIGATRELQQLKHQIINQINNPLISDFLLQKSILFHFNPPHAPHFGGLWKAAAKSFKYHLKRVTNINLTFEDMTALITQIVSLLNSRPLSRLNDDPTSLEVLTPAHFLVGESLTLIPEPKLDEIPINKLSRWQNIQQRLQRLWNRWHRAYLTSLQPRYKWKTSKNQFEIGDLVLIREDNLYPSQWIRGRVTAVHPGSDGITRVATLKTQRSEIRRPVWEYV